MFRRMVFFVVMLASGFVPCAVSQGKQKLASLVENIYGPDGLVVNSEANLPDGSTHSAHFNGDFQREFSQFNISLAAQLTSVPLPSPASGFTYSYDASTGTWKRTTQSFGPILSDRAETIGKNKFSFGLNFQYFNFNSVDGIDLGNINAVFRHDDYQEGGGKADVVTTNNSVDARVSQFTAFMTYGITDRLDISVAVPIVRTQLSVTSDATIQRVGTGTDVKVHFFYDPNKPGGYGNEKVFSASGTASGLGDVILRGKATLLKSGTAGLALGLDVRTPTGDEKDLLGAGAVGLKPFATFSVQFGKISPHLNLGYQWNSASVLAGDVKTNTKGNLPHSLLYVGGADVGINEKLTFAFDILGQQIFNGPQLFVTSATTSSGTATATFPDIGFRHADYNIVNGATGIKFNVFGHILVNFNMLFKLNESGLRSKVTPLIGIEYSL